MSLNWDISKIEDFDDLWVKDGTDEDGKDMFQLNKATDSLIWASIAVDLGSITEKNVDKWLERLAAISVIDNGAWDNLVDRDIIERHIGLKINVYPITDAKFWNKCKRHLKDKAQEKIARKERKEKTDAI
jgi:hypothetical protein